LANFRRGKRPFFRELPAISALMFTTDPNNILPPEKRQPGWNRALRILLRTVHILGFSVLLGGHWFDLPRETLTPWLYLAVFSGAGLMGLDLLAGLDWFLQLAGAMTAAKLVVLGLIPLFWEQRLSLLLAALVIGSVGSHMPGSLRHYLLFPFLKRSIWGRPGAQNGRE